MTILSYLKNPRQLDAAAIVTALTEGGRGVILDRTPFYVQGGGQPSDIGCLLLPDGACTVVEVKHREGGIVHALADGSPFLVVGSHVRAQVDATTRQRHCRLHTAGELACLAVLTVRPAWEFVTATHVPGRASITFRPDRDSPPSTSLADDIANVVNSHVRADHAVEVLQSVPRLEAERLVGRSLAELPAGVPIRLVSPAPGFYRACKGTHVESTGEIGPVVLRGIKRNKGCLRIGYELER